MNKVSAWRTSDGVLFEDEESAKTHEFQSALSVWFLAQFPNQDEGCLPEKFWDALLEDRNKLLTIFKHLNGGNPITAPTPLPERQSGDVVDLPKPQ